MSSGAGSRVTFLGTGAEVKKSDFDHLCVEPQKNTNIIAYRNAGNFPYSQSFGPLGFGGARLKPL